jgi:glycosyltransferase involved in cell wall biosynthesis
MSKTVAIVTPTFPPYRGGIGKVAEMDARQLAALGHRVTVYVPGRGGEGERGRGGEYEVRRLTPWLRYGNAAFVPGVAGLLKRHDAVILHYPFFGGAEPLWLARRIGTAKAKLIISYHMDVVGRGPLRWLFAAHTRWCMPAIIREADRIVPTSLDYAASSAIAGLFKEEPERFRELAPSVDTDAFAPGPKPPELLTRYGIGPDERVAVFVGGLDKAHYFKGIPQLLSALTVRDLAGVRAVVVGGGGLKDGYERLSERLGIAGRVNFCGPVSDRELPSHYRLGDVFVFPSVDRSEAFGIAALEAMASGVPVIASDLPGVRTIVRDGKTGIRILAGSASALAEAMVRMMGDDALRRRMGEAAREMAAREYGEAARTKKWKAIMADL